MMSLGAKGAAKSKGNAIDESSWNSAGKGVNDAAAMWQPRGSNDGKVDGYAHQSFIDTNKHIVAVAANPQSFLALLEQFCTKTTLLNLVNIGTILPRASKLRLDVPTHIVRYMVKMLTGEHEGTKLKIGEVKPQEIANALYGMRQLADSEEARELLAALTVKCKECLHPLRGQHIGNAKE